MKRSHKLLVLTIFVIIVSIILSGCDLEDMKAKDAERVAQYDTIQLVDTYELVAAKFESQTHLTGQISGSYLLCLGGTSGNIETSTKDIYKYWYKRADGGIIPDDIDMASYDWPENVTIVIYENDSINPKIEIWRNKYASDYGDGDNFYSKTEFRFTIPSGAFTNIYDLQGLT